jgi:hypothetical protein
MTSLRCGHTIRWEICGWIYRQKRLRVATEEALWATGELTNVRKKGKRLDVDLIVHTAFADKYDAPDTRLPHPYTNIPWSPSDTDTDDSNCSRCAETP